MPKCVADTYNISVEGREWIETQMMRLKRHIIASAAVLASQNNADSVLPSHLEAAWTNVLKQRSYKKQLGIAITFGALTGSVIQGLFGGVGKSIGESIFHLFR